MQRRVHIRPQIIVSGSEGNTRLIESTTSLWLTASIHADHMQKCVCCVCVMLNETERPLFSKKLPQRSYKEVIIKKAFHFCYRYENIHIIRMICICRYLFQFSVWVPKSYQIPPQKKIPYIQIAFCSWYCHYLTDYLNIRLIRRK